MNTEIKTIKEIMTQHTATFQQKRVRLLRRGEKFLVLVSNNILGEYANILMAEMVYRDAVEGLAHQGYKGAA